MKQKLYQLDVWINGTTHDESKAFVEGLVGVKPNMFTPGRFGTSIVPLPAQAPGQSPGGRPDHQNH